MRLGSFNCSGCSVMFGEGNRCRRQPNMLQRQRDIECLVATSDLSVPPPSPSALPLCTSLTCSQLPQATVCVTCHRSKERSTGGRRPPAPHRRVPTDLSSIAVVGVPPTCVHPPHYSSHFPSTVLQPCPSPSRLLQFMTRHSPPMGVNLCWCRRMAWRLESLPRSSVRGMSNLRLSKQ